MWANVSNVQAVSGGTFAGVAILGTASADLIDLSAVTLTNIARIDGGAGVDTLLGSSGADALYGGAGRDVQTGGAGADRFVLSLTTDSRAASGIDEITDFVVGADKLDLSLIDASTIVAGNQAFTFIGQSAYTGVAGQLRIDTGTAGYTRVLGDVNGDRVDDFEVRLLWADPQTPIIPAGTDVVL